MAGSRGYPPEFRAEAIRLYRESGRSLAAVAKDLGISRESLHKWVKQSHIDAGERDGLTTEERKRLRFLERENKILKEEREILKKAAAFFAKEENLRPQRRSL